MSICVGSLFEFYLTFCWSAGRELRDWELDSCLKYAYNQHYNIQFMSAYFPPMLGRKISDRIQESSFQFEGTQRCLHTCFQLATGFQN